MYIRTSGTRALTHSGPTNYSFHRPISSFGQGEPGPTTETGTVGESRKAAIAAVMPYKGTFEGGDPGRRAQSRPGPGYAHVTSLDLGTHINLLSSHDQHNPCQPQTGHECLSADARIQVTSSAQMMMACFTFWPVAGECLDMHQVSSIELLSTVLLLFSQNV